MWGLGFVFFNLASAPIKREAGIGGGGQISTCEHGQNVLISA